jgi:hypothetical protein
MKKDFEGQLREIEEQGLAMADRIYSDVEKILIEG